MPEQFPSPIPNAYWLQPGRLLAGEYPGHRDPAQAEQKVRRFLRAGVTCFIDLTEEGELDPYVLPAGAGAKHWRMPIRDLSIPTHVEMVQTLDLIDRELSVGQVVYMHCWGGVGRTGTVIGCWLVRHGSSGEDAIAEIARSVRRRRRPGAQRRKCRLRCRWCEVGRTMRDVGAWRVPCRFRRCDRLIHRPVPWSV